MARNAVTEADWMPGTYTAPLSSDFHTDGDRLLRLVDKVWQFEESKDFTLEDWQRDLIRRVLEVYPPGHERAGQLRYRQVLISLGRQNGKSVLGAVFALYGLLLGGQSPEVISLASTVPQANIIYKKVAYVVQNHHLLRERFKTTGTRGIRSRDESKPAMYQVKAGNGDTLQGVTVSMCLFDEVHISKEEAWDAMVFGTTSRPNGMVLGITTAGDDNSVLLKRLYETGKKSAGRTEDSDERFGFFLWEAPEHLAIDDPEALKAANPAIASGRIDVQQELNNIRNMPEHAARRYRLNQFVSAENVWMPLNKWLNVGGKGIPADNKEPVVFGVDRSPNWESATITAATKINGIIHTEVVASLVNPNIDWLQSLCEELWAKHGAEKFYMDAHVLKDLSDALRDKGIPVEYLTSVQMMNASATTYSLVHEKRVVHANDPLVNKQMPRAVTENVGDGFKVSRRKSAGQVDGVISTVIAVWAAENSKEAGPALFFIK